MWFVAFNVLFAAFATQISNMLTAIGRVKTTIKITIMYTILTVILVPILAIKWDVLGASAGYALVGLSSVVAIWVGKKYVDFSILKAAAPFVSAISMGIYLFVLVNRLSANWFNFVFMVGSGGIFYLIFSYLIIGKSLIYDAKKIIRNTVKNN